MNNKTTVLTNIYNEEYLLPFWLNHHKNMFDHGIIVDYRSTDKSVEICKKICPTWDIITTRNEMYAARDIDKEFMDIEDKIEGIKIMLNTTEFLFCETPVEELFKLYGGNSQMSLSIRIISPYAKRGFDPSNLHNLYVDLTNDTLIYKYDRGFRYIHNYPNGHYEPGRHLTNNPTTEINDMYIVWLGFFPFNEKLIKRKLQIKQNIPEEDKAQGYGRQHFYSRKDLLMLNYNKSRVGNCLKKVNPSLYKIIYNNYIINHPNLNDKKEQEYNNIKSL
jgi:hypothetical protein